MKQLNTILKNGSATLLGGGINHRKLSPDQRVELACDIITGACLFRPSCEQLCVLFHIPRHQLTKGLKARRERAMKHVETVAGNGSSVTNPTAVAGALVDMVGLDHAFDLLLAADRAR
jgi:hypothetical protein